MPSADEFRRALRLVQAAAVTAVVGQLELETASLVAVSEGVVEFYSDGSAALAADHYDEERAVAAAPGRFRARPVSALRPDRLQAGVLWASEPLRLVEPDRGLAEARMADVISLHTRRPFDQTITENRSEDPAAIGWRRNTSGNACKFCRMLADRGAVFRESTARFAAHGNCSCTASPVFEGYDGPEASALQYVASQRRRTDADRARVNAYLATLPD